ncbi:cell division cycle protein 20 homolog [Entelurus aequoreus]|uniref:cell division cycle protein 20 homolog n=1 Tax=Entelurus aequoreus TaxID=161455 RepID=UPI002B1D6BED|nr:cell division cycle protein 20 homolog [Entelurus aequoreus]XP_061878578.1 cell division cycle protein 20 homolog [Entelurus aequoreus]
MAQFGLENDISNTLKLDVPITNAPIARWQRKASSSNMSMNGLSPGKSVNVSQNSSKTPGRTPGRMRKATPTRMMGGDRFIPVRNTKQMEMASFLLTKDNQPKDANTSAATLEQQKALSMALNGCNIEEARILQFSAKPAALPDGQHSALKALYNQTVTPMSNKKTRCISSTPDRILDAPQIRNDFYLNLLDWNCKNTMAVALHNSVYLWDASKGNITHLMTMEQETDYVSSLSWSKDGSYISIGTSDCAVQLWDVEQEKCLRSMASHSARVCSMSWNQHILSSGSRSGQIHHHDVRVADHHIFTLKGHSQEVCGLKWSPDGRYLASGGNDNTVCIWPRISQGRGEVSTPVRSWDLHKGAVKALAWCPWQSNILASGGGSTDCHIRVWNVTSGACLSSLDTQSQVTALLFAPNYKELVSAHGYADNSVMIWKYPSLTKVADLRGHEDRILNLAMSPDCSTIASVAADETIRLWRSFEEDPSKKPKEARSLRTALCQSIR